MSTQPFKCCSQIPEFKCCSQIPETENEFLIRQLKREVADLMKTTEARLLVQDHKIAETCLYIKNNLSASIRDLLDSMKLSGELDEVITSAISNELQLLRWKTENVVNVKEFGAIGDGEADDTEAIQQAIDTLTTVILNSDIANTNTVLFPAGKYKITKTIVVPPVIKLKTTGYTALLSYVIDGPCLHFTPTADMFENSIGNKQDWFRGPWLNGEAGLLVKYMGQSNTTSIGIEIGSKTNMGELYCTSRFSMNDFRIQGFNIGMLFNRYNTYISSMNRVSYETNTIGVQYSSDKGVASNSGEKMSYTDCIFAASEIAVKWLCDGMDSYFFNTSFDYNECLFNDPNNYGYRNIVVNGCHLEGTGVDHVGSTPYGIVYGKMSNSKIVITNSNITSTHMCKMFVAPTNEGSYDLSFTNNKMLYTQMNYDPSNMFDADDCIYITEYHDNHYAHQSRGNFMQSQLNLLPETTFDSLAEGNYDATATWKVGHWNVTNTSNVDMSNCFITTNNPLGGKSFVVYPTTQGTAYYVHLVSGYIPVLPRKRVAMNFAGKNLSSYNIVVEYYDKDKTLIKTTGDYHNAPNIERDNWYISPYMRREMTPNNAAYMKMTIRNVFYGASTSGFVAAAVAQYE